MRRVRNIIIGRWATVKTLSDMLGMSEALVLDHLRKLSNLKAYHLEVRVGMLPRVVDKEYRLIKRKDRT
jgi:hypothetical protein